MNNLKLIAIMQGKTQPQSESELQSACVAWFRGEYPQYAMSLFAIPNGGGRSKMQGAILKAEGVISGIWDLQLCVPKKNHLGHVEKAGLWVEMKYGKNVLSTNQKAFRQANENLFAWAVCYTITEFKVVIKDYLK